MVQLGSDKPAKATSPLTAGLVLLVLGPIILIVGSPALDGRVYPDWLPLVGIQMLLMLAGAVLFVAGCVLTTVGMFGRK